MTWCRTQKYAINEKTVDLRTLRAGQAGGEEEEEDDVGVPVEALNDQRMAPTHGERKQPPSQATREVWGGKGASSKGREAPDFSEERW